jgi:hypothetical protein
MKRSIPVTLQENGPLTKRCCMHINGLLENVEKKQKKRRRMQEN